MSKITLLFILFIGLSAHAAKKCGPDMAALDEDFVSHISELESRLPMEFKILRYVKNIKKKAALPLIAPKDYVEFSKQMESQGVSHTHVAASGSEFLFVEGFGSDALSQFAARIFYRYKALVTVKLDDSYGVQYFEPVKVVEIPFSVVKKVLETGLLPKEISKIESRISSNENPIELIENEKHELVYLETRLKAPPLVEFNQRKIVVNGVEQWVLSEGQFRKGFKGRNVRDKIKEFKKKIVDSKSDQGMVVVINSHENVPSRFFEIPTDEDELDGLAASLLSFAAHNRGEQMVLFIGHHSASPMGEADLRFEGMLREFFPATAMVVVPPQEHYVLLPDSPLTRETVYQAMHYRAELIPIEQSGTLQ